MTGARPLLEKRVILYIDKKRKSLVSISRDLSGQVGNSIKGWGWCQIIFFLVQQFCRTLNNGYVIYRKRSFLLLVRLLERVDKEPLFSNPSIKSPSSTPLEALVPSRDSSARMRSPSPRAWRPDFPGAAREAPWDPRRASSFVSLEDLHNPGIKPGSPTLQADSVPSEPPGKPHKPLTLHI